MGRGEDFNGIGLDFNDAGTRMVIGTPGNGCGNVIGKVSVYEYDEAADQWEILGSTIIGSRSGRFGMRTELNAEGNIMALSDPGGQDLKGEVFVYEWNATASDWSQLGQTIKATTRAYFGSGLSLDNAGTRLVVGGRLGKFTYGEVIVYDLTDGEWDIELDLRGDDYYDRFGVDVEMAGDGETFIVGAYTADAPTYNEGRVYVYKERDDGSGWDRLAHNGTNPSDKAGNVVAMSDDARVVVWNSPEYDVSNADGNITAQNGGRIEILRVNRNDPTKLDPIVSIDGYEKSQQLGRAVAVSGDGKRIVIGAPGLNMDCDDDTKIGHTFVVELSDVQPGSGPQDETDETGDEMSFASAITPRFTAMGLFFSLAYFAL